MPSSFHVPYTPLASPNYVHALWEEGPVTIIQNFLASVIDQYSPILPIM